jgi:RNA polymerase sigma factor (sigma-70 family)
MEASAWRAPAGLGRRPAPILLRLRSDDQLVALFRLGNEEAFRAIHDRYCARLLAYARQMLAGSRADAEDALQDVFIRAYHALRADDRPVTLRAWLYRVAHNRCIDHLRRPQQNVVELFENVRSLDDPLDEIQRRDDLRRLIADMRRLPEQQRSALLMREMEGLTYAELADALEVTVPAVKSLLVRARMGLVDAQTARDTACVDIRADLAGAHDRGVRASGRARKHLRECAACRDYRAALRGVEQGVAALAPSPSWGLLAKLGGIGGSGAAAGGATAGGGAAAGGTALLGGAATAKVAAMVCCAAIVGGGAVKVSERGNAPVAPKAKPAQRSAGAASAAARPQVPQPTAAVAARRSTGPAIAAPAKAKRRADRTHHAEIAPAMAAVATYEPGDDVIRSTQESTGGVLAPEEESAAPVEEEPAATDAPPAPTDDVVTPAGAAPADFQSTPRPDTPPSGGARPATGTGGATPPAS